MENGTDLAHVTISRTSAPDGVEVKVFVTAKFEAFSPPREVLRNLRTSSFKVESLRYPTNRIRPGGFLFTSEQFQSRQVGVGLVYSYKDWSSSEFLAGKLGSVYESSGEFWLNKKSGLAHVRMAECIDENVYFVASCFRKTWIDCSLRKIEEERQ